MWSVISTLSAFSACNMPLLPHVIEWCLHTNTGHPIYFWTSFPKESRVSERSKYRSLAVVSAAFNQRVRQNLISLFLTGRDRSVLGRCALPDFRANFPFAALSFDNPRQDASSPPGLFDYPRLDLHGDLGDTIARQYSR